MALGNAEIHHSGIEVNHETYALQLLLRAPAHLLEVDHPITCLLPSEEEILNDVQVRNLVEGLVDDRNSQFLCVAGILDVNLFPFDQNCALVLAIGSAQDLHEGRFSGSVFAEEHMDLTPSNIEAHIIQGNNTRETFASVLHFQDNIATFRFV